MLYFRCGNFITKHWTFVAVSLLAAGTISTALGSRFCFITDNLILIKANVQYSVSHQIQERTIFSILVSQDRILFQNSREYSHCVWCWVRIKSEQERTSLESNAYDLSSNPTIWLSYCPEITFYSVWLEHFSKLKYFCKMD